MLGLSDRKQPLQFILHSWLVSATVRDPSLPNFVSAKCTCAVASSFAPSNIKCAVAALPFAAAERGCCFVAKKNKKVV